MNPADVPFLSGSELAAAIRNRKISASAALEAMIDRVERFNKPLNAVIVKDYKRARSRARAADRALKRGEIWGPIHGVPFTVSSGTTSPHRVVRVSVGSSGAFC